MFGDIWNNLVKLVGLGLNALWEKGVQVDVYLKGESPKVQSFIGKKWQKSSILYDYFNSTGTCLLVSKIGLKLYMTIQRHPSLYTNF